LVQNILNEIYSPGEYQEIDVDKGWTTCMWNIRKSIKPAEAAWGAYLLWQQLTGCKEVQ